MILKWQTTKRKRYMKKVRLFTVAALAAFVSLSVISCGDDQYSIPEEKENPAQTPGTDTTTPSTQDGAVWTDDIYGVKSDTLYGMWEIDSSKYEESVLAANPMAVRLSFKTPDSPSCPSLNFTIRFNAWKKGFWMDYADSYYRYNKTTGEIKARVTGFVDGGVLKGTFIKSDETHSVFKYRLHKVVNGEPIDTVGNKGVEYHEWQLVKTN